MFVQRFSEYRARLRRWLSTAPYARPALAMMTVGLLLLVLATVLALVAL